MKIEAGPNLESDFDVSDTASEAQISVMAVTAVSKENNILIENIIAIRFLSTFNENNKLWKPKLEHPPAAKMLQLVNNIGEAYLTVCIFYGIVCGVNTIAWTKLHIFGRFN